METEISTSTIPKTHFFTQDDSKLFEYPQIFTAGSIWLSHGWQDKIATYDLVIRDLPKNRNFLLMGGTEEMVQAITKWRYSKEEAEYLLKLGVISEQFKDYLINFHFSGDVYAMPEGTIIFPGEPVLRITAPMIEGNLFTLFLIDSLCGNVAFMSKFVRCVLAAKNLLVTGPAGIRSHSFESGMKALRAAYVCNLSQNIPSLFTKFNIEQPPALIIAYHAYIKSFPSEYEAMKAMSDAVPGIMSTMIDTYDVDKGIDNAIKISKERISQGKTALRIIVDSGDLYSISKKIRQRFTQAGLEVYITVASNLDEYKINRLVKKNIPADGFLVATEGNTVSDDPKIEAVYKMAEITDEKGSHPLAKLATGKVSLPGRKQVFRQYKNGIISQDTIGLETENFGQPLLEKYIENGKQIKKLPNLPEIKDFIASQIKTLPENLKSITKQYQFTPHISQELTKLLEQVKTQHK